MAKTFKDAIKHRRSYYSIGNVSPIPEKEIEEIVEFALGYVPSAFNSQTTRLVLLLGEEHKKLWNIVKEALRKIVDEKDFPRTESKIDTCFLSGYGTILFFEEETVINQLQEKFPAYKENFPVWSEHTSAMHQLVVWTLLEDVGFGASLQHYNPLIDDEVLATWKLPQSWKLIAQMPFGLPMDKPGNKDDVLVGERMRVFR